jgi:hypothetical protein
MTADALAACSPHVHAISARIGIAAGQGSESPLTP